MDSYPVDYLLGNPRTDWCFKTEPEAHVGNKRIDYPRGRVLGGPSSLNGMIYMRGQAANYNDWRQAGNVGWGWNDVLPYFIKSEDHFAGSSEFHGAGVGLGVEKRRLHWNLLDGFREAAEQAGIPKIDDFNRGDNTARRISRSLRRVAGDGAQRTPSFVPLCTGPTFGCRPMPSCDAS